MRSPYQTQSSAKGDAVAADNRTAVFVGILALVGAIGAAVIANWDKLHTSAGAAAAASAPNGAQTISGNNNTQISGSNNVVNPLPTPKPCRDRTHGVEKYQQVSSVSRTSNEMGGGFNQVAWCNQVTAELRAQNPDGTFEVESSSEKSRSTCSPFNCPQYQYTCTVRASTNPLFVEKLSSACR